MRREYRHFKTLSWPESSITSYRKTQKNILANPAVSVEKEIINDLWDPRGRDETGGTKNASRGSVF